MSADGSQYNNTLDTLEDEGQTDGLPHQGFEPLVEEVQHLHHAAWLPGGSVQRLQWCRHGTLSHDRQKQKKTVSLLDLKCCAAPQNTSHNESITRQNNATQ